MVSIVASYLPPMLIGGRSFGDVGALFSVGPHLLAFNPHNLDRPWTNTGTQIPASLNVGDYTRHPIRPQTFYRHMLPDRIISQVEPWNRGQEMLVLDFDGTVYLVSAGDKRTDTGSEGVEGKPRILIDSDSKLLADSHDSVVGLAVGGGEYYLITNKGRLLYGTSRTEPQCIYSSKDPSNPSTKVAEVKKVYGFDQILVRFRDGTLRLMSFSHGVLSTVSELPLESNRQTFSAITIGCSPLWNGGGSLIYAIDDKNGAWISLVPRDSSTAWKQMSRLANTGSDVKDGYVVSSLCVADSTRTTRSTPIVGIVTADGQAHVGIAYLPSHVVWNPFNRRLARSNPGRFAEIRVDLSPEYWYSVHEDGSLFRSHVRDFSPEPTWLVGPVSEIPAGSSSSSSSSL